MPCPICDDTGWAPVDQNGVRRVMRCDCWRERVGELRIAEAKIPLRYQHCTLENFRPYNESLRQAVVKAQAFLETFPGRAERGLLLIGHAGVGKTHIAVAVLRAVMDKTGGGGLFVETSKLLTAIRSSYDPVTKTSAAEILRPVMEAPFVVLDDLGAERPTDWVEETMNLIVNTRYSERRMTFVTTNFSDVPDIEDPNTLLCRIGFRMRSRLHEMCTTVEIDAADWRDETKPKNATDADMLALWQLKHRPKDLPTRATRQARAQLRDNKADLKWPGGRAGS